MITLTNVNDAYSVVLSPDSCVIKADFDGYRDERLPEMYKSAAFNGFEVGWEPKV